ncbi:MAG: Gfo/Idh/MocA family oxidoreductase [Planctomycetia bacterium]|nr:Gfo/Idh/MocA family oxidoreductase [Planctomycetia bacterium]
MTTPTNAHRRDFIKATAAAGLATAVGGLPAVHAGSNETIRVGLIGCGGRGSGAAKDVLSSAPNVEIYAIADIWKERHDRFFNELKDFTSQGKAKEYGNRLNVSEERRFLGFDAYKKVLDSGVNYVMLCTPPGFRPMHLEAAVKAGKNIFTEKPVAVDGPGIRKVYAAYEEAKQKGLNIVAGTQRRHQLPYVETIKKLHEGAIGDIHFMRCYWNQGVLWKVDRTEKMSDLEWQLRNWYNFMWICGDHIVEQHIHNIDVCNWVMNDHPIKARGSGFRTRTDPNFGHIYDHFSIEYEYPKNVFMHSMCRQISGCWDSVSEQVFGSNGHSDPAGSINGKPTVAREAVRKAQGPYVQEHTDLIEAIRSGKTVNELKTVADSTLTAIMGRMSAYSGKEVTWDAALNSTLDTFPKVLDFNEKYPAPPVPIPGKYKFNT